MKKVVFVGGTRWSGSTFFDMILANDPKGFACGEVHWLFNPQRAHHVNRVCGCGDKNCPIWPQVLRNGESNLYETIFELLPEVEFIVDSSKNLFWIRSQSENLLKKGIQAKNVLIWKTPLEFAESCRKRGLLKNWDKDWIHYHRLYFSIIENWRAVKYCELVGNGSTLEKACQYLEIPYFQGKERYWEKTHHVLGGNWSARFHLYPPDAAKDYLAKTFSRDRMHLYRTIYYSDMTDQSLHEIVEKTVDESEHFERVLRLLKTCDVSNGSVNENEMRTVRFPAPLVKLRRVKNLVRTQIGRFRYGRRSRSSHDL